MTYDFTLIIDATFEGAYPDAEDAWMNAIGDVLFERYEGDATLGIRAGVPCVSYSVDAPSMETALRDAVTYLEHPPLFDSFRNDLKAHPLSFRPSETSGGISP